jgi:hypothetical protein
MKFTLFALALLASAVVAGPSGAASNAVGASDGTRTGPRSQSW